jgi:heptose I phosphotransferase
MACRNVPLISSRDTLAAEDGWFRDDVASLFNGDPIGRAWELEGQVARAVAGRETLRIAAGGKTYYLKRHRGVGWGEVFKNWLVLKRPVIGARNEYEACLRLASAAVAAPTVAAFAESGGSIASRSSFVMCDALMEYEDLEALTERWFLEEPAPLEKRRLVTAVARFARRFHDAGVVHRDFYICHLLINAAGELAVLDLHRALIFEHLPVRWRERDLAALLYSTLDLPLSRRSWLRFVREYSGRPLREVFDEDGAFWFRVYRRALALYRKGARKGLTRGRFVP